MGFREASKSPATRKRYPPREARLATLAFAARRVRLLRPVALARKAYPDFLDVNVVRVEEFNKALNTGCKAEARQLIELGALLNAIAILTPIAWAILHLRPMPKHGGSSKTAARRHQS
ncbi:hypothetical protein POL68_37275 [Stigmatella sp. ncwal1]|uniref:Uncharacterized protein n=1 Tax=Stigmatella ashevillensis TaxID=2995309 RepID=A0ABT5DM18_9BACT|nr:hypothetical protein [Stigmatella ashevillena]MDC0714178.1 hypothetical protein [Stigmatella ashevillena]